MDFAAGLAGVSLAQIALVGGMALFASLLGGIAGYGTGALLPLVLVPISGPETVVPIIAITALFTNTSRAVAFRDGIDMPRTWIVLLAAIPTCILGAYGFTLLTGRGALIVIGLTLIASIPLRRLMRSRGLVIEQRGLAIGSVGYGVLVGGTTGSGVVLLSLLMASGLSGAGVIATDARDLDRDGPREDRGVRNRRHRRCEGARLCAPDRRDLDAGRLRRQGAG